MGIRTEDQMKIFNPFFTTKGIGGLGLGLWISQSIMKRHEGSIRIRSRESGNGQGGTVVTMFVPFTTQA